jgi:AcrR family transcriptional regulator
MAITKNKKEVDYDLPGRPLWAVPFLRAYAKLGNTSEALTLAGVSRRTVYRLRDTDELFKQALSDAEEDGADELEGIAKQRAKAGSDVLLMFLLKGLRPWIYRDNHHVISTATPTNYTIDLSLPTGDDTPHDADQSPSALLE